MTRTLIIMIASCALLLHTGNAQETSEIEWFPNQIDSLVSISFPCDLPKQLNWTDSSHACGDSTFEVRARVLDLGEEIAAMGPVKQKELTELVYRTRTERMSRYTKFEIERKLWRWKKQDFDMWLWHPASIAEAEFYYRIRSFPWGPDMNNLVIPPLTRYERLLFYNNKLYIFSMTAVTINYHDREYYMRGGRTEKELRKIKEKFFRSIDVKKKPAKR